MTTKDAIVRLTPSKAESSLQQKSLRRRVVQYLASKRGRVKKAPLEDLEKKFRRDMAGVVAKLAEKGHVTVIRR